MDKWVIKLFNKGLYTNQQMKVFVECKWITPEQYKDLTKIEYTEEPRV